MYLPPSTGAKYTLHSFNFLSLSKVFAAAAAAAAVAVLTAYVNFSLSIFQAMVI